MKKRNLSVMLLCAALTMALLAGCGGGGKEDGKGDVVTEAASGETAKETVKETTKEAAKEAAKETKKETAEEPEGKGDLIIEEPEVNAEDFYGVWEYDDADVWLYIYGDGTLEWFDDDGSSEMYNYYMEDGELCIEDSDLRYILDGEGGMIDSDGDTLFVSEIPEFESEYYGNGEEFFGCWKYTDEDYWVYFYGDGTYETFNEEGSHQSGNYHMEDDGCLYVNEQEWVFMLVDGGLADNYGDYLVPSEGPGLAASGAGASYIEERNIELNYELDQGDVLIPDAAFYFERGTEGAGYTTGPLQVSMYLEEEKEIDRVFDGENYIERTISVYLGVPEEYAPEFENGITAGCKYMFYDGFNGTFLPDAPYFEGGNGEGSYYFEFETSEGWADLTVDVTNELRDDIEGYTHVFMTTITVTAPPWYDGLIFNVPVQPDTYAERVEFSYYTEHMEEFIRMENQPYDFENGLNCPILN